MMDWVKELLWTGVGVIFICCWLVFCLIVSVGLAMLFLKWVGAPV